MKFLQGSTLTKEIQSIVKTRSQLKIAVAYWGQDALKLSKISTRRKNLKLLCCLKGGKSDPDIVKKFGRRIRQNDKLHAKVIWTASRAVVSSANLSSNGLSADEGSLRGLIEAGVLLTESSELQKIERWFDDKYRSSRLITKDDLKKAKDARPKGGWGGPRQGGSLISALRERPEEFRQLRIAFALWTNTVTTKETRAIRALVNESSRKVEETLKIGHSDLKRLDYFVEWGKFPSNTFIIDCQYKNGKIGGIWLRKTFDVNKKWPFVVDGERRWVHFALKDGIKGFNYTLSRYDRSTIRRSSRELWRIAGGEGGIVDLHLAAPILLRSAKQM
jgi:hypothetical protein